MSSVKRSLANSSPKKRWSDPQVTRFFLVTRCSMFMILTQDDPAFSCFRQPDPSFSRPTVEQIAMGLHVSRTPHLRPLHSARPLHTNFHDAPSRRPTSPSIPPPTPIRSSLKMPPTSNSTSSTGVGPALPLLPASASSTTVASNTPATPHSSNRSLMSLKFRVSRFLPGLRAASAPSSLYSSPHDCTADIQAPRKAVRFSTQVVEVDEDR